MRDLLTPDELSTLGIGILLGGAAWSLLPDGPAGLLTTIAGGLVLIAGMRRGARR